MTILHINPRDIHYYSTNTQHYLHIVEGNAKITLFKNKTYLCLKQDDIYTINQQEDYSIQNIGDYTLIINKVIV